MTVRVLVEGQLGKTAKKKTHRPRLGYKCVNSGSQGVSRRLTAPVKPVFRRSGSGELDEWISILFVYTQECSRAF